MNYSTNSTPKGSETSYQTEPVSVEGLQKEDEANKLIRWVNEHWEAAKSERYRDERQWYLNLSFYRGRQNVVSQRVQGAPGVGFKLVEPPAPYWRARPIINRIRPIVRTELAKVTSQKPNATVIPASSEDKDLFAAQAGEQIWESWYRRVHFQRTLTRALWWSTICGTSFIKAFWDPTAIDMDSLKGVIGTNPLNQDPLVNAQEGNLEELDLSFLQGLDLTSLIPKGDIIAEPVTPFHIYVPDLFEEDIEGQPYIIHASTKTCEWVKLRYSKTLDGKDIKPTISSENDIINEAFLDISRSRKNPNSVLVLEIWFKPGAHPMFPNGGMATIMGDQLVQAVAEYPYQHMQFPVTKFDNIPMGRFYSDSIVTDLIPLQREYNRTRGQIIEAKNRMAKPQMVYAEGSLDPTKITTEPGQYIPYKAGFQPPTPLPLQPLPNYVLQELDRILLDMDDISGQHEVSKGQVPAGVTAATAISYLQEQDDTRLSLTIDAIEHGVEKIARHVLSHVGQFWTVERTVKVVGADGSWDAEMFKGSSLAGNTDIRVEAGSALPTSKAAKQAFIMDLMKMGFIPPEEGLRIMEIGGVQKLYEQLQIDERHAQRENLRMANVAMEQVQQQEQAMMDPLTGQPVVDESGLPIPPAPVVSVNTWDNHAVHIVTHNNYRKSQSFEKLPPHIKVEFERHVQLHMASIAAPHSGGMPTAEMMVGIAQQQAQMPPPSDTSYPTEGEMAEQDMMELPPSEEGMNASG